MIAELLEFSQFLLKSINEISERAVKDINVMAMDGKFNQESFCEALPGMFNTNVSFLTITASNSHIFFYQCQSWATPIWLKIITILRQKFGKNIMALASQQKYKDIIKFEFEQHSPISMMHLHKSQRILITFMNSW